MLGHRVLSRVPDSVLAVLARGVPADFIIAAEADPTIDGYRTRQQELIDSQTAILARADAEKREMTTDESTEVRNLASEFDRLNGECELRERTAAQAALLSAPRGRLTDPDPIVEEQPEAVQPVRAAARERPVDGVHRVPAQPRVANGMFGFRNAGEFAIAVKRANPKFGSETDKRLIQNAAASTYGNESTGQDGGFLVPPDMRTDIMQRVFGEDSLVGRTDRQRSSSNTITFPADMTTPWQSSGGIQAYWTAEAATKTQSKPVFENLTVKAHTLAALIPVTEELLEDAPALDGYLRSKTPEVMDFKISDALIRGNGVGQPLGVLNSPALVTVSKESGQAADTINTANVLNMWGRLPLRSRGTAVWLMNPDVEPKLPAMVVGQQPVYMPPGGLSQSQYGILLGRPVIPHQVMETIGDLGDIGLFDFNQYLTLTKVGGGRDSNGMRADVSIHLWFDQDLVAYRFTIRLGGQPWWSTYLTPRDGTNYQSPFVILEAR